MAAVPDLQLLSTIKAEFLAAKAAKESRFRAQRRSAIATARNELMVVLRGRLNAIRASVEEPETAVTLIDGDRVQIQIHQMNNDDPFPFKENGRFFIDGIESPTVMYLVNESEDGDNDTVDQRFRQIYGIRLQTYKEVINGRERVTFFVTL